MEKVFCHPEVHHPYIIMRQITSTDFIFQYSPLFPTPKALFISKPLFSIFCYPDQRHFFLLGFELIAGHPLINFSLSLRPLLDNN